MAGKVWFVTGSSRGLGRAIVQAALQAGDRVVATARRPGQLAGLAAGHGQSILVLPLDVTQDDMAASAAEAAVARFGRIDVLVNNAGYGLVGAVEEASDTEIAGVHETNVFGLLRVTRAVLPHFRERRSGHVVNLSSIGGLVGLPGFGIYNATKFAVEGLSEAMANEVAPLGIRVTVVEPGPFRTDFLGGSLATARRRLADYDSTSGQTRASAKQRHGNQPGDPVRCAEAIIKVATSENPPRHLLLGRFAYERATAKLEDLRKEIGAWREVTLGADYENK